MRASPTAVYGADAVRLARGRQRRKRGAARHAVEYAAFRVASGVLTLLPEPAGRAVLRRLARAAVALSGRRRRILLSNLAQAFPQRSRAEIRHLARRSIGNVGDALFDFLAVSRTSREELSSRIEIAGIENLEAARARGRGVFLLSAHFGGWELGAIRAGTLGEPISVVVRALDNPLLDREVVRRRTRFGNRLLPKKESAREILRAMRANETVAILVDQNVLAGEALFVPFFGRLAATTPSLALLQLKTGAAVVPVFTWPRKGGRYRLEFETPILPEEFGGADGRAERVRGATARYMEVTEAAIRRDPAAWLWIHDRWKTRPK